MTVSLEEAEKYINETCEEIRLKLIEKNRSYKASAFNPIRIFSRLSAEDGVDLRMDDKLSRLMGDPSAFDERPEFDLAGYLILKMAVQKVKKNATKSNKSKSKTKRR